MLRSRGGLGLRDRPFAGDESAGLMLAIAERLLLRLTATAQGNRFLAADIKLVPVRVEQGDRTRDEQGAILAGANRNVGHDREFLQADQTQAPRRRTART